MEKEYVKKNIEILKKEIQKLRVELTMFVLERDELLYVECKNLETAYYLAFGTLEYKVYEARCTILRLRRKIELMQQRINRQELMHMKNIEVQLDAEFEEYQKILNAQIRSINDAIEYNQLEPMNLEEVRELKTKYHHIVKTLHPDINPDISEEQVRIFENAVRAYKKGDLQTIRMIYEMVDLRDMKRINGNTKKELQKERDKLLGLINEIQNGIEIIKKSFPYTEKELLQNSEKKKAYRKQLQALYQQHCERIEAYQERITEMRQQYE